MTRPLEDDKHLMWDETLMHLENVEKELNAPPRNIQCEGFLRWILSWLGGPEGTKKSIERKRAKAEKEMEEAEKNAPISTIFAFVTYNYPQAKRRALSNLSGGCLSQPSNLAGKAMRVKEPPRPIDIRWRNLSEREYTKKLRVTFGSYPIMLMLLALSVGLQFLVGILRTRSQQNFFRDSVAADFSDSEPPSRESVQALSAITGLIVLIFNQIGKALIRTVVAMEKHNTFSDEQAALVYRIGMFQVLNAVIPVLGNAGGLFALYTKDGFIRSAFYVQIISSFVPDLLSFADLFRFLRRWAGAHACRTQYYLDKAFGPSEFALSGHYGHVVKTLGMSLAFGPMAPFSFIIGLLGITSTIVTDRYVAFHRAKVPRTFNDSAARALYDVMWHIGFLQALFNFRVYFVNVKPAYWIFLGSFVFYFLIMLVPTRLGDALWSFCFGCKGDGPEFRDPHASSYRVFVATRDSHSSMMRSEEDSNTEFRKLVHDHVDPSHFKDVYAPNPPRHLIDKGYLQHYIDAYEFFPENVPARHSFSDGQATTKTRQPDGDPAANV